MTFLEMCQKTEELAKAHDRACYLYEMPDGTLLASLYYLHKNWLFKAYPGGRTILSERGKNYTTIPTEHQNACHACKGLGYRRNIGLPTVIDCPVCKGTGNLE